MEILIAGGGIGGLTLAHALRAANRTAHVFERDTSPTSRPQGYGIGLFGDAGLRVLRALGLEGIIEELGRPWGRVPFLAASGEVLQDFELPAGALVSLPRDGLRRALAEHLPGDAVTWDARCVGFQEDGERVIARFADGTTRAGDLLVACDGTRSELRAQLLGDSLSFLGLTAVSGTLASGPAREHELVRGGGFLTVGDSASLYVQDYAKSGRTLWSLTHRAEEDWGRDRTCEELRAETLARLSDWHRPARDLVEQTATEDITGPLPYYDREPLLPREEGRVALLGDAAHPMSPFQGQGANTAMLDAEDLARRLSGADDPSLLPGLVASYHEAVFERARDAVLASRRAAADFHAPDAAARVRAWSAS